MIEHYESDDALSRENESLAIEVDSLRAEVERLTKARDAAQHNETEIRKHLRCRIEAADLANAEALRLLDEVERLKACIRTHHNQKADDRCHLDDDKLYHDALGIAPDPYATALPPTDCMLESCRRYIRQRQHPETAGSARLPGDMTIAQLTAEVERLKEYEWIYRDLCK